MLSARRMSSRGGSGNNGHGEMYNSQVSVDKSYYY